MSRNSGRVLAFQNLAPFCGPDERASYAKAHQADGHNIRVPPFPPVT
jgi:hypothetical protein